jgi:hypothetical protein
MVLAIEADAATTSAARMRGCFMFFLVDKLWTAPFRRQVDCF